MTIKNFCLSLFLISISFTSLAQTLVDDALRYTHTTFGGSARATGLGGAFTALGADLTSLSTNPAGLGFYRKSEFAIAPNLYFTRANADYLGTASNQNDLYFNVNSAGVVFSNTAIARGTGSRFRAFNFGFGFNRMQHYNGKVLFRGENEEHSISDYYAEQANGTTYYDLDDVDFFGSGMAWASYMIDLRNNDREDQYIGVANGSTVEQIQFMEDRRALDEYVFGFGANYDDRLYFGMGLNIPVMRYQHEVNYEERNVDNSISDFEELTLVETLDATGGSIKLNVGLTYRISEYLRIGGAFHFPQNYRILESYSTDMGVQFATSNEQVETRFGNFEYNLKAPAKALLGASVFLKKRGFITVDYELVNYSNLSFDFSNNGSAGDIAYASELNAAIKDSYKAVSSLRLGGELAIKKFRLRGGLGFFSNPYTNENLDGSRKHFSLGWGVREKGAFFDMAYVRSFHQTSLLPYDLETQVVESALINHNNGQLTFGFGVRF